MDIWTIYIIYLCLLDTIPNVPFQHNGLPLCLPTSMTQRTQIMMDSSTCTVTLMSHSQVLSITRAKKHQGLIYKWQMVLCRKREHSRTVESYDVTLQRTFQRWCRASLHTTEATFRICCIMWAKLQISCAIARTLVRGSKFPLQLSSPTGQAVFCNPRTILQRRTSDAGFSKKKHSKMQEGLHKRGTKRTEGIRGEHQHYPPCPLYSPRSVIFCQTDEMYRGIMETTSPVTWGLCRWS